MKSRFITLALALVIGAQGEAPTEDDLDQGHPVKNVIAVLRQQQLKVDEEGQQEQRTYNKFKGWCERSLSTLAEDIESARAFVSKTKNAAFGKEKAIEELDKSMARLDAEMTRLKDSVDSANSERADAKAVFDEASSDMNDTIDALDEALEGLANSSKDAENTNDEEVASGAAAVLLKKPVVLAQLSTSPKAAKLEAMLEASQPEPHKKIPKDMVKTRDYEFKSGNIVKLLSELKEDFTVKLRETKKEEDEAITKHGYLVEDLNKATEAAKATKSQKEENKADANSKLSDLNSAMDDKAKKKSDDEKEKADTEVSCKTKAAEFKERKEIRYNELHAIKQAMDILSEASGVQTEKPENDKHETSLLSQSARPVENSRSVVVNMLRERAHRGGADAAKLERLAQQVEASEEDQKLGADDAQWKKEIIQAIDKQASTLKDDQLSDDEKFQWCETEVDKTNVSHKEKTAIMQELNATILEKQGKINLLQEAITAAHKKVADLNSEMEERTRIREENKEENAAAIHDAKIAQVALAKAISVLSTFYEGAAAPAALVQTRADDKPETWGKSYTGSSKKAGVVGILEEIEKDMATMEVETRSQEASDKTDYEQAMLEAKKAKATAETEISLKTEERSHQQDIMRRKIETRKITDRQLATVQRYLNELTVTCDEEAYETRKSSRTDQINDLEESRTTIQEIPVVSFLQLRGAK